MADDLDPSPWRERAACAGSDVFVVDVWTPDDVHAAEAVCAACPVRSHCDDLARSLRPSWGVWAGVEWRRGQAVGQRAT